MNSPIAKRRGRRRGWAGALGCLLALGLSAGASLAATPEEAPPLAAGQARVWFLHQLLPGTAFHPPMIYANGAPVAISPQGTAFYRDFAPGNYVFSVENCLPQANTSQNLVLEPDRQFALQVQADENGAWDCIPPQISYLRPVPSQMLSYLFAQLSYLGAR